MRISEIYINGLYGVYTYKIANLLSQNLLVLTGYNGMGKTTILNIVKISLSQTYGSFINWILRR